MLRELGWGLVAIACNFGIALVIVAIMSIIYAVQH